MNADTEIRRLLRDQIRIIREVTTLTESVSLLAEQVILLEQRVAELESAAKPAPAEEDGGSSRICGFCRYCAVLTPDQSYRVACTNGYTASVRDWWRAFMDPVTGTQSCAAENCPGFAKK